MSDVRYALRTLARSPAFTAAALTLLALGIGFNTTAFSLVDAVLLRSLPQVARPKELVSIEERQYHVFSYASFRDLRDDSAFSGVAAWGRRAMGLASSDGPAERVRGVVTSANYFDVLGVRPQLGRFFVPAEEESGETVVVLTHGLWQRRFGGARGIVDGTISINGTPFTVIGVAPRGFRGPGFGEPPDLWIPVGAWPRVATGAFARLDYHRRSWGWMSLFGRLAPGIGAAEANAALRLAASRELSQYPDDTPKDYRIEVRPLSRSAAGAGQSIDPARLLGLLLGAVGVALLIACANLANLLIARGIARRREMAVRVAIGASRGRLVRQMLVESLVLALSGGVLGILVASWTLTLVSRVPLPGGLTIATFGPSLDARVLAFTAALSIATGVLFGLVPSLQASRVALLPALKDEVTGGRRALLRGSLVSVQVALCLLLLAGAGLLVRSLRNMLATDVGFEPRGVALAFVHLGPARYDAARAWSFASEAASRAAALPGARSAAWAVTLPLSGDEDVESVELPGQPKEKRQSVAVNAVGPGYFKTLGVPIVAGREFDATDAPDGVKVVVVNEAAARKFWPGEGALGKRLIIGGAERTVAGVCRDSLFGSWNQRRVPQVTAPIQQLGGDGLLSTMALAVRSSGDPRALLPSIRSEIARMDGNLPVFGLQTLEDVIAGQLVPQRFGSGLLSLFAALSLLLATVGVYAVVSAAVAMRRREMGVRMALGAQPGQLSRLVLKQTAGPLVAGLAAGLPLALGAARLLSRFLYGITPGDVPTFAGAVLLLALGGLVAAGLPARRAAGVDPIEALRNE
jgi:predicted permease